MRGKPAPQNAHELHKQWAKKLYKNTTLRSGNRLETRMKPRNLGQLRRLLLYPTELRADVWLMEVFCRYGRNLRPKICGALHMGRFVFYDWASLCTESPGPTSRQAWPSQRWMGRGSGGPASGSKCKMTNAIQRNKAPFGAFQV